MSGDDFDYYSCSQEYTLCKQYIANNNKGSMLSLLFKNSQLLYEGDAEGNTCLHLATLSNKTDIVELILEFHNDAIDYKNVYGETPLMVAIKKNDSNFLETVRTILMYTPKDKIEHAINYALDKGYDRMTPVLFDPPKRRQTSELQTRYNLQLQEKEMELNKYKNKIKELESHLTDTKKKLSDAEENMLCIVCMERTINSVLMNCAHMTTCYSCASNLRNKVCPICNNTIQTVIKTVWK
eukprot:TRINITY_DN393_c1_g3_i1.p1 TRINITY_DN393_c1_g3~~TRINITY_DN393_c1_g3_i1.p1  ORF type:complete len:239 (-),score=37.73 TRINITY_DN393_c1_g3_i1:28-744(-)